ncbi:MAG: hypothetical protein ACREKH_07400, partial [Candidatus Rokuibacteriota bacterium]
MRPRRSFVLAREGCDERCKSCTNHRARFERLRDNLRPHLHAAALLANLDLHHVQRGLSGLVPS